jgi:hypothetical protein
MFDRASWFARLALRVVVCAVAALILAPVGCGRSSLVGDQLTILYIDAGKTCDPSVCTGCCANGACLEGTALRACGSDGNTCADCTTGTPAKCEPTNTGRGGACVAVNPPCDCSAGETCDPKTGACVPTSPCGPCTGCCINNACLAGTVDKACGANGGACETCGAGQSCAPGSEGGGVCTSAVCGPTNCAGCCSPKGCMTGTLVAACGTGGHACQACAGAQCAPAGPGNGGVCVATGCNPQNCPGCCDANGLCQAGTGLAACGGGGGACATCSSTEVCVAGACAVPAGCGPQSCAGCCSSSGCVGGGSNDACGSGGGACQSCGNTATCVANVCQTAGACDATTCPTGCCDGNLCRPGTNDSACGSGGAACAACGMGTQCANGACQVNAACGPSNCSGCCAGNTCFGGTAPGACGVAGAQCAVCASGSVCVNGSCEATCGPVTCTGCCQGGVCALGGQADACGTGGNTCQNCAASGAACTAGACVAQPCGPGTCAGCCDASGNCLAGAAASACGAGGSTCSDCASIGDVCVQGACKVTPPLCTPASCPLGCCDGSGVCQDGFLDAQCGSGGIACLDCTQSASTCAVNQTPRGCTGVSTTCPSSYAGCPSGTVTPTPMVQAGVCTPQDLAEAQAACVGGPDTTGCASVLKTLTSNGAQACALCLQPFMVPFAQGTGVFLCAAPFLSPACNQATGCYSDCETKTCSQCPASGLAACQGQVATGTCSSLAQGLTCVAAAQMGPGAFCDPTSYPDFGSWLKGVGGHYCE